MQDDVNAKALNLAPKEKGQGRVPRCQICYPSQLTRACMACPLRSSLGRRLRLLGTQEQARARFQSRYFVFDIDSGGIFIDGDENIQATQKVSTGIHWRVPQDTVLSTRRSSGTSNTAAELCYHPRSTKNAQILHEESRDKVDTAGKRG